MNIQNKELHQFSYLLIENKQLKVYFDVSLIGINNQFNLIFRKFHRLELQLYNILY